MNKISTIEFNSDNKTIKSGFKIEGLEDLTVITGKNNSGKTNFIKGIEDGKVTFSDVEGHVIDGVKTIYIAAHVNKIWPGLLPRFDWQVLFTSYANQMALDRGLLDTTLPLDQARQKFYVTDIAQKIGYANNFYALIRQPDQEATSSPSDINK